MCVVCRSAFVGVVLAGLCLNAWSDTKFVTGNELQVKEEIVRLELNEESLAKARSLSGWERDVFVHDLAESVESVHLEKKLHWLARQTLGRVEVDTVYFLLVRACLEENAQAVNVFSKCSDKSLRGDAFFSVGWQLADENLELGLAMIGRLEDKDIRDSFVNGISYSLRRYDLESLVYHFEDLKGSFHAREAMQEHIIALAEVNPLRSFELLRQYDFGRSSFSVEREILRKMVDRDVDSAVAFLLEIEDTASQRELLNSVVEMVAESDVDTARSLISTIVAAGISNPLLGERELWGSFVSGWSEKSPVACLEWVMENEDPVLRGDLLGELNGWALSKNRTEVALLLEDERMGAEAANLKAQFYHGWSREDPARFIEWSLNSDLPNWSGYIDSYHWQELAASDPALLQGLSSDLPNGEGRNRAIGALAAAWEDDDTLGFLDWVDGLGNDRAMETAMYRFFEDRKVGDDLVAELELANALPEGPVRDVYQEKVAYGLSHANMGLALELVVDLSDSDRRTQAFEALGRKAAYENPDEAIRLAGQIPELANSNFLEDMLLTISFKDPEGAYRRLDALSEPAQVRRVSENVFRKLFEADEEYAVAVLEGESSETRKSGGWKAIANRLSSSHPEESLAYASRIVDPELRVQAMVEGYGVMQKHYPERALEWLENSELSLDERARLAELVDSGMQVIFPTRSHCGSYIREDSVVW